jgi:hypothetical protein
VGDGFWTKPTYANPKVSVGSDGSAQIPIVTGNNDQFAIGIVVWLIPATANPPQMSGQPVLPQFPEVLAIKQVTRGPATKKIRFAGTDWDLKRRDFPYDPGPCYYSDDSGNIWLDENGYVHLTVGWENGHPVATEMVCQASYGYGWYTYTTHGRLDQLDPFMVFGSFFWDVFASPSISNREMDIEVSLWNKPRDGTWGQYVIQPVTDPWNSPRATRFGFTLTDQDCDLTNVIHWEAGKVTFWTYYGKYLENQPPADKLVKTWSFADSSVPTPGQENFRFNFWLYQGHQPTAPAKAEVVVTGFNYSEVALPTPTPTPSDLVGRLMPTYIITTPSIAPVSGQTVNYTYDWTSDGGKHVIHGPKTDLFDVLNDQELTIGETWTVKVTPTAGGVDGSTQTAKVKIVSAEAGVLGWVMYR